ncbi:MAG: hypothetical protein C3F10_07180 [Dehalococcoidia bacterium]|nr:MAG: hypothetical protein C3F10_07180 [Dehalococcoidia bacterium]
MLYEVRNHDGRPLAILEAADATDAQLFASRTLKGWDGQLRTPATPGTPALEAVAESLGYTGAGKAAFLQGRDGGPATRMMAVTVVPRQEASDHLLTEAQRRTLREAETTKCPDCGTAMDEARVGSLSVEGFTCPKSNGCGKSWIQKLDGKLVAQESARDEGLGDLASALGLSEASAKAFIAGRN